MGKGKAPCCDHSQILKRGPWSDEESEILKAFILKNGHRNWRSIPKLAGHDVHRWAKIASHLGRTDNEIKNVWNTHLKKRLIKRNSSASSDVTNQAPSVSRSSSSSSSSVSNNVIKSEKLNQEEELEQILVEDMASGFEVNAPQSLESLFEDRKVPPPITKPDSLEIRGKSDDELCRQMVEPGQEVKKTANEESSRPEVEKGSYQYEQPMISISSATSFSSSSSSRLSADLVVSQTVSL
ncbi:hypothetical protein YC2023_012813 [Brassica napus]